MAGNATWEFDGTAGDFVIESGFSTTVPAGFTAVADLGDFPGVAGDVAGQPEVISAMSGFVSVRTLSGGVVATIATSTGGNGGPPTVADFDGDGVREFGVAFGGSYEVFDLAETSQRLWTKPSQDLSSSRTGSSVFDFNADGRAEVVYGDECFVRVYDGTDGEVIFSQARFSSTWTENPIVADVDGDASAEMVVGASGMCNTPYCPLVDPIFEGLRCEGADDCPSGTCTDGLCRCADDTECPTTYGCSDPLSGSGDQVCRAFHRDCVPGIRVYRDGRDRWAELAHHLEPARLSRHQRQRRWNHPAEQRRAAELVRPDARQLPPERSGLAGADPRPRPHDSIDHRRLRDERQHRDAGHPL